MLHHVEVWLEGGSPAWAEWGWMLDSLGCELVSEWSPLYHERYPHAGGPDHYAGWVENSDGFKVEIVALK